MAVAHSRKENHVKKLEIAIRRDFLKRMDGHAGRLYQDASGHSCTAQDEHAALDKGGDLKRGSEKAKCTAWDEYTERTKYSKWEKDAAGVKVDLESTIRDKAPFKAAATVTVIYVDYALYVIWPLEGCTSAESRDPRAVTDVLTLMKDRLAFWIDRIEGGDACRLDCYILIIVNDGKFAQELEAKAGVSLARTVVFHEEELAAPEADLKIPLGPFYGKEIEAPPEEPMSLEHRRMRRSLNAPDAVGDQFEKILDAVKKALIGEGGTP